MKDSRPPIVSIVMPSYNVEQFIAAAIDSVQAQTFEDWELLVVDDGSTDGTCAVAQRYARSDSRIKVLRKENGGLSDARNNGLERARGELVHFFDSDDRIVPEFYSTLVAAINGLDFVVCGYFRDVEQEDGSVKTHEVRCEALGQPLPVNRSYFQLLTGIFNYAWNKLYRKSFLDGNNLMFTKGLSIIEDKEFISRVLQCAPAFAFIDFSGYRYQIRHRATLGNQYTDELIPCHLRGIEIQCAIMERFTADGRLLSVDKGNYALFTVKWILTCLFSYSGLSKTAIMEKMTMALDNESVQNNVKNSAPPALSDKVLRKLICGKNSQCIYWLYKVFK